MEAAFLDKLPLRFRKRFRGDIITLAVVIALFAIPSRSGDYGIVAFFTIAWVAQSLFYLAKLRAASPPPGRWAYIHLSVMTILFGYPIVAGWFSRSFDAVGLLAFVGGGVVLWVFIIVNRTVVFPSIFGAERRPFLSEFVKCEWPSVKPEWTRQHASKTSAGSSKIRRGSHNFQEPTTSFYDRKARRPNSRARKGLLLRYVYVLSNFTRPAVVTTIAPAITPRRIIARRMLASRSPTSKA